MFNCNLKLYVIIVPLAAIALPPATAAELDANQKILREIEYVQRISEGTLAAEPTRYSTEDLNRGIDLPSEPYRPGHGNPDALAWRLRVDGQNTITLISPEGKPVCIHSDPILRSADGIKPGEHQLDYGSLRRGNELLQLSESLFVLIQSDGVDPARPGSGYVEKVTVYNESESVIINNIHFNGGQARGIRNTDAEFVVDALFSQSLIPQKSTEFLYWNGTHVVTHDSLYPNSFQPAGQTPTPSPLIGNELSRAWMKGDRQSDIRIAERKGMSVETIRLARMRRQALAAMNSTDPAIQGRARGYLEGSDKLIADQIVALKKAHDASGILFTSNP